MGATFFTVLSLQQRHATFLPKTVSFFTTRFPPFLRDLVQLQQVPKP